MTDLANEGAADASANDTLRASLEAAFDTPATPQIPVHSEATPTGAEPRDERGRFAKSGDNPEAPKLPQHDAEQQTGTEPVTRKPPASWSKEQQALWDKIDPAIQDTILKRESDVSKGFEEKAAKYKPWERIDTLIAPHLTKYQMQGITGDQLVERLVHAHNLLENPQTRDQAWQFLMQQYGAPQFLAQQTAAPIQQAPNLYEHRLGALEATLRQQHETALLSQIETFAKDRPHFEKAAPDIEKLLRTGAASTLEEAYNTAVWANADVRKQMLEDEAKAQAAQASDQTAKAKRAASSVTGAPTGTGSSHAPKQSLREELESAFTNF